MKEREYSLKTADGINLYAKEWIPDGKARGLVILVHGLGEHCNRYQHVAEAFCAAGFAMVGFDLRGHGRSGGTRGHSPSIQALIDDFTLNIDTAKQKYPGLPLFLYGHSLGGNLVLYYLLTQELKVKGAIVTSPALGLATPVAKPKLLLAKLMYSLIPTFKMNNGLDVTGLARDEEVVRNYTSDPLVHHKVTVRLGLDIITIGGYLLENAFIINTPILLLQGSSDRIVTPGLTRQLAQNTPPGMLTFKEYEGYYHELHNEPEKAEVIQTMVNWLKKMSK